MDYYPIFLDVRARPAVIVGGGAVAERKIRLLLEASARLRVVAPEINAGLRELADAGRIEHRVALFSAVELEGAALVIAATDEVAVNAAVAAAARARGIPVNVVDDPQRSTFILPAVIDRSPVIVAVGTQGTSPVLARLLREKIEALLAPRLGHLAALAGEWRSRVKASFGSLAQRRRFWERIFEGTVGSHVLEGREAQAELELRRQLRSTDTGGEVFLVGAGPGDPDLLTLKAARLLQQADVVLYDRLVSDEILNRVRRDAERIYVGKDGKGTRPEAQTRIHDLMISLVRQGKRVVRLKGGDPFIFGRGGEEQEVLARAGIPVTVVPGITAALGAAAATGIPLTHRDHAQSVTFVTGHSRAGAAAPDWRELARPQQTAVFYMGLAELPRILAQLIAAGAPLSRPAALIERATHPDQRVIEGTLGTLAQQVTEAQVHSPSLLIVGDVVSVRARLSGEVSAVSTDDIPALLEKRAS